MLNIGEDQYFRSSGWKKKKKGKKKGEKKRKSEQEKHLLRLYQGTIQGRLHQTRFSHL